MRYRNLGNTNEKLSAVGLGCMGMSHAYGVKDDTESIATLHKALDLGVNFWDTADFYGKGENEKLISKVLTQNRDKIFIATKFGFREDEKGSVFSSRFDGSPAWMREAIEGSLKRLGVDHIDLYYTHRVDPNVPIEETVGAMAELVKEGKVKYLGLSEASASSIKKAHAVHPISALQSEYSLITRDLEKDVFPVLQELQISLIPFSPLSRGLLTDNYEILKDLKEGDARTNLPRFQGENLENNLNLAHELKNFAEAKGIYTSQLALAWILAQGDNIIPIAGTKKRKYLERNAAATAINLTSEDLQHIDQLLKKYPNIGKRYPEGAMKLVDKD
ncbi:MAG TPA: aldo/keto reductase [Leeuwenhoekiella sp.]|nr:aldo/keto reductase [Leeuwenhoekiella sp.]